MYQFANDIVEMPRTHDGFMLEQSKKIVERLATRLQDFSQLFTPSLKYGDGLFRC